MPSACDWIDTIRYAPEPEPEPGTIGCATIRYDAMRYDTLRYDTIPEVPYRAVRVLCWDNHPNHPTDSQ